MKHHFLSLVFIVFGSGAFAADGEKSAEQIAAAEALANAPAEGSISTEDGLAAWDKVFDVFSHPRCANCHVDDGVPMWSGSHYGETRPHGMYVGGDPDLTMGQIGQQCNTCHMDGNSPVLHGPPGNAIWQLAPAEFAWFGVSSRDVCEQVKDPSRNGDRTLFEIAEHIEHDALVHWGWTPGPGREPAPGSLSQTVRDVLIWGAAGAPCPTE